MVNLIDKLAVMNINTYLGRLGDCIIDSIGYQYTNCWYDLYWVWNWGGGLD